MPTTFLQRGLRPPPHLHNDAICWQWVATHKELGQDPGGLSVIDQVTEW